MSRGVFFKTCVLLAVTTHTRGQYLGDFFNSFLQPFTTNRPRNEVTKRPDTKHRQTNKQKYQDAIFFETDDFVKQRENSRTIDPFDIYSTTTKPRRKSKTSTTSHSFTTNKPKSVDSNNIVKENINSRDIIRSISNNNNVDNKVINNARRLDNYNNGNYNNYNVYGETTKPTNVYGQNYDNRQTTQRPTNFNGKTTQKTDYYGRETTRFYNNERTTRSPAYNKQTTRNPLLNRPGVKPAAVDDNRPPITNRPVTKRPIYEHPFESVTYRSPQPRPPVNTRPPFETERPISTGVVQPVSGVGTSKEDVEIDIELGPDEEEMSDVEKRRLYDICEQKCDEYKAMRVRKVVALPLGGAGAHRAEVNVSSCVADNVPLIIGGQLARIETFPHMALLGWKFIQSEGYAWKCGGSLVSEQYVLTAGHCTYHDKDYNVVSGPPGAVQLGSAIYNDRTATVARVSLVVRHPKYKLRRSYYDVALLKLAVQVSFSDKISPACLGVPPAVGEPVIATGWGKTEFGGDSSFQLRSVSIPIWDMGDCREIWGTSLKLPSGPMPENQVCAGERKGAKDTCQGDSGGPAQVRDGCSWRVVAVTSVGRSCGAPETPALYARVPRAFIAKQVFTNIKTVRDGNNQYVNEGINLNNNNGNGNTNWSAGNDGAWSIGTSNNGNGNNNGAGNNNWSSVNNNRNTGNNNNGAGNNNWNSGNNNNNGAGNNNWSSGNSNKGTISNQNGNHGVADTRPIQNNNGQNYNNPGTPNNNQYYGDSQGSNTDNRGIVSNNGNNYDLNNRNNNWAANSGNNRYNQNGGNNRNVYDQSNNNGQTTNGYNQNNYGQNSYNKEQSHNGRNPEIPSDMRNYESQSYVYNDNGSTDNGYNKNNGNGYSIYPVANKPWWTR